MTNRRATLKTLAAPLLALLMSGCASTTSTISLDGNATVLRRGTGKPVVVMQAGFGDGKASWAPLLEELSRDYTLFAYDRPGLGAAPAVEGARDPCSIATELRSLLQTQGLAPPYLLVGHSLGGLYHYAFARLYPDDVAAYVLIDPTHPRNIEVLEQEMPTEVAMIRALVSLDSTKRREFKDQTACLKRLDATRPLAMPGKVLISGRAAAEASPSFERRRRQLALEWPQITGGAELQTVLDSGHYIHRDAPEVVLAAIHSAAGHSPRVTGPHVPEAQRFTRNKVALQVTAASTNAKIEQAWGSPAETLREGDRTLWVYHDKPADIPTLVSWLPIVGDIADVVETVRHFQVRHEWIFQFDDDGLLLQARQRNLE